MVTRVMLIGPQAIALRPMVEGFAPELDLTLHCVESVPIDDPHDVLESSSADIAIVGVEGHAGEATAGFELLGQLRAAAGRAPITTVLVSARDDDAARAFELEAGDFLREPVQPERLRTALVRARGQVLQRALIRSAEELQRLLAIDAPRPTRDQPVLHALRRESDRAPEREPARSLESAWNRDHDARRDESPRDDARRGMRNISVREGRRTRFIPLAEVDWFEADGNYILVHAGAQTFRTRGTISNIEAGLDPRQFARIHRRVVVNMDRVRELDPLPGGDGLLRLGGGATLRLSRTYRGRVKHADCTAMPLGGKARIA